MSNYPPYQMQQPYQHPLGPYMPPYQPRVDMSGPSPMPQQPQQVNLPAQGQVMGLSPVSRPVTSKEEAMGVAADFSGAPMVFPDVSHDRVYIKRWDLASGGPAFQEYAPVFRSQTEPAQNELPAEKAAWVSLQDFQDLQDLVEQLKSEIDRLKKPTGKAAVKNDPEK